jgi:hypothetical protein
MECIDTRGQWKDIFKDESRKIPQEKLAQLCLMNNGDKTCRYIMMGEEGYVCVKNSKLQQFIDERVSEDKMIAKGDNCKGIQDYGE